MKQLTLIYLLTVAQFGTPLSHSQPVIVQQPQSQTNLAGANAVFSVAATGLAPLGYQWRSSLKGDIAGATGPTLLITNIQPSTEAFSVLVSDASGSLLSDLVRIYIAPTIILQPAPQSLPDGSRTSF